MPKVKINGRDVYLPDSVTSDAEIREEGHINPHRNLIRRTREGNYLVPRGARIDVQDGDAFVDAPARTKGAGYMFLNEPHYCIGRGEHPSRLRFFVWS